MISVDYKAIWELTKSDKRKEKPYTGISKSEEIEKELPIRLIIAISSKVFQNSNEDLPQKIKVRENRRLAILPAVSAASIAAINMRAKVDAKSIKVRTSRKVSAPLSATASVGIAFCPKGCQFFSNSQYG